MAVSIRTKSGDSVSVRARNRRQRMHLCWKIAGCVRGLRTASRTKTEAIHVATDFDSQRDTAISSGTPGSLQGEAPSITFAAKPLEQLTVDFVDRLQLLSEAAPSHVAGLRSGFPDLDELTTGMHEGDLIVIAGPPSVGKTALSLNIVQHVAIEEGLPVLVFSMASSAHQTYERFMSLRTGIDLQRLRSGRLRDHDWCALSDHLERLAQATLLIDDHPELWIAELRLRAQQYVHVVGKLGLIVVDYVQLLRGDRPTGDTRANEVAEVMRGLKALARTLSVPVIALSQINRGVEMRVDKRPTLSDLRDSGAIAEEADVVLFLYRDEYYNKNTKQPGVAELIVGRQRNGPEGWVHLLFTAECGRFASVPFPEV
jgi:replicative DNA helicase